MFNLFYFEFFSLAIIFKNKEIFLFIFENKLKNVRFENSMKDLVF